MVQIHIHKQTTFLDLGLKEPGGSVGICSNPSLPPTLAMQWCCEALREAAVVYRNP